MLAPSWLTGELTYEKGLADGGTPVLEQLALADFLARGELDRHLRRMRLRLRERRLALLAAVADAVPGARASGVPAGLFVLSRFRRARRGAAGGRRGGRGVGVEALSWHRAPGGGGEPGLVLGYGNLPNSGDRARYRPPRPRARAYPAGMDLGLSRSRVRRSPAAPAASAGPRRWRSPARAPRCCCWAGRAAAARRGPGLAEAGARAEAMALDVTDADAGERMVAGCLERFGPIDALVNNAGTSAIRTLDQLTDEDWQAQWELHVMAPMRLMRAAAPEMAERGLGADRQRLLLVGQAAVGDQHGLLGHQGGRAVAVARVRRRLRSRRACWSTRSPRGRWPASCGSAPGGLADQVAAGPGTARERGARATAAERNPLGRLGRPGRDRRRDRVPVLGAWPRTSPVPRGRSTAGPCP